MAKYELYVVVMQANIRYIQQLKEGEVQDMNVLRIELIRKVGNVKEYRIIYEENDVIETKLVGRTFNYNVDPEELNFPESVLDFAENWILGDL